MSASFAAAAEEGTCRPPPPASATTTVTSSYFSSSAHDGGGECLGIEAFVEDTIALDSATPDKRRRSKDGSSSSSSSSSSSTSWPPSIILSTSSRSSSSSSSSSHPMPGPQRRDAVHASHAHAAEYAYDDYDDDDDDERRRGVSPAMVEAATEGMVEMTTGRSSHSYVSSEHRHENENDYDDDHDDDDDDGGGPTKRPRDDACTAEEERRGAKVAAVSLLVALSLFVAMLSSYSLSNNRARGPRSTATTDPMLGNPTADGVIRGGGGWSDGADGDKFVIGEEEMNMMEMEGDLYYYDDDQYYYGSNDDASHYYEEEEAAVISSQEEEEYAAEREDVIEQLEVTEDDYDDESGIVEDPTEEITEEEEEEEEDDDEEYFERVEVSMEEDVPFTDYSNASNKGTLTSEESGEEEEVIVTAFAAATTGGGGGTGGTGGMANDGGGECSVVRPVDYNAKFQRGTGYENFPGYQCYRTVEGTKATVTDLLARYPTLTSNVVLSDYPTAELGQRLQAFVITNKNKQVNGVVGKGKMLVVAAIHAREIATAETMMRFAEYLLQQYGNDPDVTWIVDYTEIHLIFQANPDGRKYLEKGGEKTMWKKNRNKGTCASEGFGVDPNRNFPFKWGQCITTSDNRCSSSDDCSSVVYRGPSPSSERETKAILAYAASIFPSRQRKGNVQVSMEKLNTPFATDSEGVFIDVHSHGRLVGWPWGFANQRTPNDAGLGALGRKFASFSGYSLWAPKMPNRKYGFDGGTIDTMYGWLGAASFFFEIGTSFYQPCETLSTVINEVFPALMYAAKVAKQPYKAPRGPDILCTTITSTVNGGVKYISATIEVSDDARTKHTDDGGVVFSTGLQTIKVVEIYVNCHPLYSATSCQPTKTASMTSAGTSTTVTMLFKAPSRINNVMYIRAIDSYQHAGPVTARKFVGGSPW